MKVSVVWDSEDKILYGLTMFKAFKNKIKAERYARKIMPDYWDKRIMEVDLIV